MQSNFHPSRKTTFKLLCTQGNLYCLIAKSHGLRRVIPPFLTSPWGAMTAPKFVSWWVCSSSIDWILPIRMGVSSVQIYWCRDKTRKDFSNCFGGLGLKITAQSNQNIVNYVDVTLDLSTGKYYPYRKPDNNPLYINVNSNHPPSIIKQLPKSISTRISSLSCNSEEFNKASKIYNDAL